MYKVSSRNTAGKLETLCILLCADMIGNFGIEEMQYGCQSLVTLGKHQINVRTSDNICVASFLLTLGFICHTTAGSVVDMHKGISGFLYSSHPLLRNFIMVSCIFEGNFYNDLMCYSQLISGSHCSRGHIFRYHLKVLQKVRLYSLIVQSCHWVV